MNLKYFPLKIARKGYSVIYPDSVNSGRKWTMFHNKQYSNNLIYETLLRNEPCMISRLGSTETNCLSNYLGVKNASNIKAVNYIKNQAPSWWWEPEGIEKMQTWSGFFPLNQSNIENFCQLMLEDMKQIDILGSWLKQEKFFSAELQDSRKVMLEDLEPFFSMNPWTRALEGKKVLVVHPFSETIEAQYKKKDLIFENNLLPEFHLKTIKAVQSIAGAETKFSDWFEALDYMKEQIDSSDYDICIIGAGAYGLPLAAHVKRSGKKAFHLAGATQLLFGIKGKRWEEYIVWPYANMFNEHWVRPGQSEKPANAKKVEDACYW